METSAKTAAGVEDAFVAMAKQIKERCVVTAKRQLALYSYWYIFTASMRTRNLQTRTKRAMFQLDALWTPKRRPKAARVEREVFAYRAFLPFFASSCRTRTVFGFTSTYLYPCLYDYVHITLLPRHFAVRSCAVHVSASYVNDKRLLWRGGVIPDQDNVVRTTIFGNLIRRLPKWEQ